MKKKRVFKFCVRFITMVIAVVMLIYLPAVNMESYDELSRIYNVFVGNKSEYQGVIEVWNIDTFESGVLSKTSFLENRAKEFQARNKGLFLMIRNITENECYNMLKEGQKPDLFSCSYGVSLKIKDYITTYSTLNVDIYSNFLKAGIVDNKLYGLAWCCGFYCLISTQTKLEKAGKFSEDVVLSDVMLSASYDYKLGKKEKTSYSLTYGTNGFLMPKNAILSYNNNEVVQTEKSVDVDALSQTQYSAYCRFLTNDATILLGNQRDISRMKNKEKQGKCENVIYEPMLGYTDLVQFMFLANNDDGLRKCYSEKFAMFLVEEGSQKKLENIGMFTVKHLNETDYSGVMRDITLENKGNCRLFGVFDELIEFEQP